MSIISEALKKAQEKRTGKDSAITSAYDAVSYEETFEPPKFLEEVPLLTPESPSLKRHTWSSKGFIALAAVFALIALFLLFTGTKKDPAASSEESIMVKDSSGRVILTERTKPATMAAKKSKNINLPVLSGIMYSPTNPQAVINGVLVSEGEAVGGFTLTKISPTSVKLNSGSNEFVLYIQ